MGLIIDYFAGGGGASEALEIAYGRKVDIAINHDAKALAMHAANHPETLHIEDDVFSVDIAKVCAGRPIDVAWFSPDCTHHSRAKGGKPRSNKRRGLAWVVLRVAALPKWQRPRVIHLENVVEFADWGPLTKAGFPDKSRKGETFRLWVSHLEALGYDVAWQRLKACDYGAPTIRDRLFLTARCDGLPIVWPKATHFDPRRPPAPKIRMRLQPYRMAAECIDWSLPCRSIFERPRPLKENTMRRIARGVMRYVIDNPTPFIIPVTHGGDSRCHPIDEPLRTITTANGGEFAVVAPSIVSIAHGDSGGRREYSIEEPLGTIHAGGRKHALVAAFLAQFNNHRGVEPSTGRPADAPLSTITTRGTQQQLVAAHLLNLKGTDRRDSDARAPMPTVCAGGTHIAEIRAFLIKYYGSAEHGSDLAEPMHCVTAKDRFGLVIVSIAGVPYAIVDIGMRMLTPRELFRAQGFADSYVIDVECNGRRLSKADQIEKVGNSVSPPPAIALAVANAPLMSRLAGAV